MKCNGKTQNRKSDRNYGRCDICEIVYGSEMVIQLCGSAATFVILGFYTAHAKFKTSQTSLYLIVVAPDTIQYPILLEVNHLASAAIGLLTKAGRPTVSQFHPLSPRSSSCATNGRLRMPLESDRDNASKSGSGQSNQEEVAIMEPQISGKGLAHQSLESLNSVLQESMQQESVQQSALAQGGPSTEHSESVVTGPSTRPTLSVSPPSSTVKNIHEVWKLSEALDKLRQQQRTLTHYIRQLKYIRRQASHLIAGAFTVLEMDLSDSQAETGSSDDFNDETADGLDPIETAVEGDNAWEFVISTSGSSSNVVSSAVGVIDEARTQRSACQTSLSSVTEVVPHTGASSVTAVTTILPTSGPSGIASKRRTRAPTSSSTTKRRKLAQSLARVEVKLETSQQAYDGKATEAVSASAPKSGIDPIRLRWVRQLLSHPQSRVRTFAELDKLVIDHVSSASSSSGSQSVLPAS
ncbi:unnamed protein product [Taenia asiatica]|uniref:PEHE domain-containing protein n=1 Tax=Taenia asiatica TaxID=60517 RepID=A0A158R8F5_TAEAS|nr:unnamed protein product [Taenia asiatica]